MMKRLSTIIIVATVLLITASFIPTKVFGYWFSGTDTSEDFITNVQIGNWGGEPEDDFQDGLEYPPGSLVRYGGAYFYNNAGTILTQSPAEAIWQWTHVPSYAEVTSTPKWNASVNYMAFAGIVEHNGFYYRRSAHGWTIGIAPDAPGNLSWVRILSWQESRGPTQWSPGSRQPTRIFEHNGQYYAQVLEVWFEHSGPLDTDNRYRLIPVRDEHLAAGGVFTDMNNASLWATPIQYYHSRTWNSTDNKWDFWELRGGVWNLFEFPCQETIVITTNPDGSRTIWDRQTITPTNVAPTDPGQTVWTSRPRSTNAIFVYTMVAGTVTLWQNASGVTTTIAPGSGAPWVSVPYISSQP